MNARKIKGEQLAKTVQIEKKGIDKWIVPSQSGRGAYTVNRPARQRRPHHPEPAQLLLGADRGPRKGDSEAQQGFR